MVCLGDFAACHWNGSLGYCCSNLCDQNEGQPTGRCRETASTTSAPSKPTSSKRTTPRPECLDGGSLCTSNGSLGFCCSNFCNQLEGQSIGKCVGSSLPTGLPAKCLDPGAECKQDTSLGVCCSGYCDVRFPHVIGTCNGTRPVEKSLENFSSNWIIIYSCGGVIALVLLAAFIWLYRRQQKLEKGLSKKETDYFFEGNPSLVTEHYTNAVDNTEHLPYNKELEIHQNDFEIDFENPLGQGAYGLVLKGTLRKVITVAVKTLRNTHTSDSVTYLRALLGEIKILQYLGQHDNIVGMIGCHTAKLREGNVFVFLEYCPEGSLEKILRANKHTYVELLELRPNSYVNIQKNKVEETCVDMLKLTKENLLKWSRQITSGMKYLADKKVIHADLATRNVLLRDKDCCKITDFGLSRKLYEYNNYVKQNQEPLPWRWMALESLQQLEFSHQSDVWSLGVTLWEIFSLGDVPYPGLTWTQDFVQHLENDFRPSKPTKASDEIYAIMLDCWKKVPSSRPNFTEVYERLYACSNL